MQEALLVAPYGATHEVRFDDCRRLALAVVAQVIIDAQADPESALREADAVDRGAVDHWLSCAFDDPDDARLRLVSLLRDPDRLASVSVSAASLAADRAPLGLVTPGGPVTQGGLVTPGGPVTHETLTFYLWLCMGDPTALAKTVGTPPKRVRVALAEACIDPSELGADAPEPRGPWTQPDLVDLIIDSDGELGRVSKRLQAPKLIVTAALRRWGWLAPAQLWGSVRVETLEEMNKWRPINE